MSRYSRQDVLRMLHLHHHQLAAWERAGLAPDVEHYEIPHIGQIQTLLNLKATRLPSRNIRASVLAMSRTPGIRNPLLEATAVRRGSGVSFRYAGALLDPVTQQLAFDFDQSRTKELRSSSIAPAQQAVDLQEMFLQAVRFEEDTKTLDEAAMLYGEILQLRPHHAPASINLGTIHYNRRDFARAEELYRNATAADPEYALAFFDLGNVLDETLQLDEAVIAYQRAIALVPHYADAHYNLALAYERQGERRRALRHWLIYSRLDPVGPWCSHAKIQARKILSSERLSIVSRRGQRVPIAG